MDRKFPSGSSKPTLTRTSSIQTRYMEMLLSLDEIPRLHNMLASFLTWILLAGFIVFPGTFTSFQQSGVVKGDTKGAVAEKILGTVGNVPLLWVAGACCIIGGAGMIGLWWRWSNNYVWLINRIFLPGFLNSIAGLISTLVNVYTAQHGNFSITAKVTAIVTGGCTGVTAILFVLYNNWILQRVKTAHQREMDLEREGDKRESVMHMVQRKAHEPALEPGTVV